MIPEQPIIVNTGEYYQDFSCLPGYVDERQQQELDKREQIIVSLVDQVRQLLTMRAV